MPISIVARISKNVFHISNVKWPTCLPWVFQRATHTFHSIYTFLYICLCIGFYYVLYGIFYLECNFYAVSLKSLVIFLISFQLYVKTDKKTQMQAQTLQIKTKFRSKKKQQLNKKLYHTHIQIANTWQHGIL